MCHVQEEFFCVPVKRDCGSELEKNIGPHHSLNIHTIPPSFRKKGNTDPHLW